MIKPLLITQGEPAGIAPEIIAQAWQYYRNSKTLFFLIGDANVMRERAHIPVQAIKSPADCAKCFQKALPVIHRPFPKPVRAGIPEVKNASTTIALIDEAVKYCRCDKVCGMVTAPIDKSLFHQVGFTHQGHTDYLAYLDCHTTSPPHSIMMLAADNFRCVPVTVHVALKQAIQELSSELITITLSQVCESLRSHWSITKPRIAVGGLNPHAGEQGYIGDEEIAFINPTLEAFRAQHCEVYLEGTLPSDSMFSAPMRSRFDAFVTMTHDQALIPMKTLYFDQAVNITLGLSFVRTSPDHGTAYDLAGTQHAKPDSMIAAIAEAWRMSGN